jgi:hypothetical protein
VLVHHVFENGCDTFFSQRRVCHAYDCFEAAFENAFLLFNVSELLFLNLNSTNFDIIKEEMARKLADSEADLSRLVRSFALS